MTESLSQSPLFLISTVALSVFTSEVFVMPALHYLPPQSLLVESVTGALLQVILISPVLYVVLFRPLVVHVSERRKAEDDLHKNEEEQFKTMVRASMDGFWVTDSRGCFLEVNDAYCKMLGYSREELLSMCISDIEAMEMPEETARRIEKLIETGKDRFETRHRRKNGEIIDIEISSNHTRLHGGRFYSFLRNITKRKREEEALRENESRLKEMFENLTSGVAVYRASGDGETFFFTSFNRAAENIDKIRREDLIGKSLAEVFPGVKEFGLLDVFRRVWRSGAAEHFPVSFYHDGRISGWRDNYVYKLQSGEIVAIYDDVTKEKQTEEQMHHLAYYDLLTGLPNRILLVDRLRQSLANARRKKMHVALMFIDLDKFKPVNDTLGHDIGDLLLKEVAKRLQNCVRESDTISRIGGDEFMALLPAIEEKLDVMPVAGKILYAISQPFELAGHSIDISSSIGVAVYPEHGDAEQQLIKNADIAMYYAKYDGRNNVKFYQPEMLDQP